MLPGDLLQWLSLGQKTGTLVVTSKSVEKKVFFKQGRVISSASNDPRDYLGQFLISHGFISEAELMKAMEVQHQSGILLGKILVMIDVIPEGELVRLMRLKAEEEIYDIFLWREGEFRFLDDELPTMEMIPLQVDVTGIIMEGTRRVDEWSRIREGSRRVAENDRPCRRWQTNDCRDRARGARVSFCGLFDTAHIDARRLHPNGRAGRSRD